MNPILTHVFRFIVFSLAQTFILNKLDLGFGAQVFLLPLYLFLLPFETNVLVLMAIAFGLGISVDVLSNTMGLNASSLVFFAFLEIGIFVKGPSAFFARFHNQLKVSGQMTN